MEHIERYYEKVTYMLHEAGLFVCPVNSLLIKQHGNNSLHSVKTDKTDTLKIVKYTNTDRKRLAARAKRKNREAEHLLVYSSKFLLLKRRYVINPLKQKGGNAAKGNCFTFT